jgi:hypothetical protein
MHCDYAHCLAFTQIQGAELRSAKARRISKNCLKHRLQLTR